MIFGLKRLLDIFAKKIHETKMARGQPRPQRHLKILDKLKIITLYEKEASMPLRKFADFLEIKLGWKVC